MTAVVNTFNQKSTFVSNLIVTERGKKIGIVFSLKWLLVEARNSGNASGYDLAFYENDIRR